MNKKHQCSGCGRLLPQEEFLKHKADNKNWNDHCEKEYLYPKCIKCCYKNLDLNNKNTILDICLQFDVPCLEEELQKLFNRFGYQSSSLTRYLNLMRLKDYYGFGFEDTARIEEWRQQRLSYERNGK